jgi:hypothetical protein
VIPINNDELNDKTLAENERHWRDIGEDKPADPMYTEAANIAEDQAMDERDGF